MDERFCAVVGLLGNRSSSHVSATGQLERRETAAQNERGQSQQFASIEGGRITLLFEKNLLVKRGEGEFEGEGAKESKRYASPAEARNLPLPTLLGCTSYCKEL